jgi:hypothetical protein
MNDLSIRTPSNPSSRVSAKKIAIPSAEALGIFIRDYGMETEIGELVI